MKAKTKRQMKQFSSLFEVFKGYIINYPVIEAPQPEA